MDKNKKNRQANRGQKKEEEKPEKAEKKVDNKKKKVDIGEDQKDLEEIIIELRNDIVFKDIEFKEIRDELEIIRKENLKLLKELKEEKMMRQCLESNKLKYQMMKELLENADTIENKTFFNLKRDEGKNNGGLLMNQVIE